MFSRTVRSPTRPSVLRFSEQNAMRWPIAVARGAQRHRAPRRSRRARGRRGRRRTAAGRPRCGRSRAARPGRRPRRGGWSRLNGAIAPVRPRPAAARNGVASARSMSSLPASRSRSLQDGQLLADHLGDQLELGQLGGRVLADQPAVAQHRHAVGDLVDLVQEVGDEQDRDARRELADDPEQLATSPASRLDVGSSRMSTWASMSIGPGDRDHLLDRERVVAERPSRGRGRGRAGPAARRAATHGPASRSGRSGGARGR